MHTEYLKDFSKNISRDIFKINVDLKKYSKFYNKCLKLNCAPINSHSWVGQLIISDRVKKLKGKAVFGGEGADELFGGYSTYTQKISNYNINNSDYTKLLNLEIINKKSIFEFSKVF